MEDFTKLSDKELYQKCRLYGLQARKWIKKFGTLLPEVQKRELYKKYGFYSIFEFAAKLAGMGRETVLEILRISRRLEDKPLLYKQIEEEGWSKLKVIANVATKETEQFWSEKVKKLSKIALETYVREIQKTDWEFRPGAEFSENEIITIDSQKATPTARRIFFNISLETNVELRLKELQKKLEKERRYERDDKGTASHIRSNK